MHSIDNPSHVFTKLSWFPSSRCVKQEMMSTKTIMWLSSILLTLVVFGHVIGGQCKLNCCCACSESLEEDCLRYHPNVHLYAS